MPTRKSTTKKQSSKQKTPSIEGLLAITAFILPLIAWLIAALINPSGWASDQPEVLLIILVYLPAIYWQPTLVVCICVFAYFCYRKPSRKSVSILLMLASVVLSAYAFQLTVSADESEFTG